MTEERSSNDVGSRRAQILTDHFGYREDWLSDGSKVIVPVAAGTHLNREIVHRLISGCRTRGVDAVVSVAAGEVPSTGACSLIDLDTAAATLVGLAPPVLLAASDASGAVLFTEPGHALVAGTPQFLQGAAPEGVDEGRARFARYARATVRRWPNLATVARSLPVRQIAWSRAGEAPPETGVGRQVELMRSLVAGSVTGAEFARAWLDARRLSQNNGERLREPLATVLDRVFSVLEDYSIDPDLKDPEDLTDDELKHAVRDLMEQSRAFG